jgi:hypothetical protein
MSHLTSLLRTVVASAVLHLYPHRNLGRIRIIFADIDIDRSVAMERLEGAFKVLDATDASRSRHVHRYVRRIVVWAGHFTFATPPKSVYLASSHLLTGSSIELASTLVHEAVHLRIERHGIRFERTLRERIEHRCILEQTSFLRRQGAEGEEMAELYEEQLEVAPWWTDESQSNDVERVIKDVGIPRWVAALLGKSQS